MKIFQLLGSSMAPIMNKPVTRAWHRCIHRYVCKDIWHENENGATRLIRRWLLRLVVYKWLHVILCV